MWKDYWTMVYKPYLKWLKRHWIGYILWSLALCVATYLWISGALTDMINTIKEKFQSLSR